MPFDPDAQQHREYERQRTVEAAVEAADRFLLESSDGSKEMTEKLTSGLAIALVSRLLYGQENAAHRACAVIHNCTSLAPIIMRAVKVAYEIILRHPEDDPAVVCYLKFAVANAFWQKTGMPILSGLNRYDMQHPAQAED